MGVYAEVKCEKCGYSFSALHNTISNIGEEKTERLLTDRGNNSEISEVYKHMKTKKVSTEINVYCCYECKDYYNYKNLVLEGESGTYYETKGVCPKCKQSKGVKVSIDSYVRMPGEKCSLICPKCMEKLVVVSGGISD